MAGGPHVRPVILELPTSQKRGTLITYRFPAFGRNARAGRMRVSLKLEQ